MTRKRLGGVLLLLLGILTLGTGVYFLLLRPPLLPEDVRFTGLDPGALDPRLRSWLGIVFRTLGGFIAGFGILLGAAGGRLLSAREGVLLWGIGAAIIVAFGRFLFSNLLLHSDHLAFISVIFVIALAAASCLVK